MVRMYIRPIKGIAIILLVLLIGVFILACAPVDSEGNPIHTSTSTEDTTEYIIQFGDKEITGVAYKIVRASDTSWTEVYDVDGRIYYTSIENILLFED